jgi:HD-GYP domain-containing protein (c-di-GMP phosphodiesterase class II)
MNYALCIGLRVALNCGEVFMRHINVNNLTNGMILGSTIRNSSGEILLQEGVVLNSKYIDLLRRMGITGVTVCDEDAQLDLPEIRDVVNTKTRQAAVSQIKNVLLDAKESGRLVIEPRSLYDTVGAFTEELLNKQNLIYNLVDLRSQDDYTFAHSVNVCILSLMTGITMGYKEKELSDLGVGALLHDLGKIRVPDEILNKPGSLTEAEFNTMKTHTVHGHDLIKNAGNLDDIHAVIAIQHHENYDGSGYPEGLAGTQIEELSQIVAIADRFDAITAHRVYRKPFKPVEAFAMCEAASNYYVKESVARAFIYNIAAYPANTIVELNNGMIGITSDTPKGSSLFPMVKVYYDEKKRPLAVPFDLALYKSNRIFVTKVLESIKMPNNI